MKNVVVKVTVLRPSDEVSEILNLAGLRTDVTYSLDGMFVDAMTFMVEQGCDVQTVHRSSPPDECDVMVYVWKAPRPTAVANTRNRVNTEAKQ